MLQTLGLDPHKTYTSKEIKTSFRKKARELHPDAGGSATAFQQAKAACEALISSNSSPANRTSPKKQSGCSPVAQPPLVRKKRPPISQVDVWGCTQHEKQRTFGCARMAQCRTDVKGEVLSHRPELFTYSSTSSGFTQEEVVSFYRSRLIWRLSFGVPCLIILMYLFNCHREPNSVSSEKLDRAPTYCGP